MSVDSTNKVNDSLTFADVLFIIRKNLILLLTITIAFGIGGGVYGFKYTKPTYTAVASVFISKNQNNDIDYSHSLNIVESVTSLFARDTVAIKVSEALSEKYEEEINYKEIKNCVKAEHIQYDLNVIVTFTTSRSPEFAIDAANQYINSMIEYADNDLKSVDVETGETVYPLKGKIIGVDYAIEATKQDNSKMIFILSVLIGFILGVAVIVIKHLINDTFTSREEFERQTGLNVLVMLPNPVIKGDSNAF